MIAVEKGYFRRLTRGPQSLEYRLGPAKPVTRE